MDTTLREKLEEVLTADVTLQLPPPRPPTQEFKAHKDALRRFLTLRHGEQWGGRGRPPWAAAVAAAAAANNGTPNLDRSNSSSGDGSLTNYASARAFVGAPGSASPSSFGGGRASPQSSPGRKSFAGRSSGRLSGTPIRSESFDGYADDDETPWMPPVAASVSWDGTVTVYEMLGEKGIRQVQNWSAHNERIYAVAKLDSYTIATGSEDG